MNANPDTRPHRDAAPEIAPRHRSAGVRSRRPPSIRWDRRRFALRIGEARTSGWRIAVQAGFTLVSIAIGIQFARFVAAARATPSGPLPVRPPGIEGYLPISGLIGLIDWIRRGALNTIHPAATVLFLIFVVISFVAGKAFCSWICPIGFLSENLARFGRRIFGRNPRLPRWLDVPLRALKYALLAFFLWAVLSMAPAVLSGFIESPYNKVADVKMLQFFAHLGGAGLITVGALVLLSIPFQGFWCRYLCPYGALLGIFSRFSPVRVHRDRIACTDCGICDRVCPARLPVSARLRVASVECIGCTDCVASCPIPNALRYGTRRRSISPLRVGLLVVGIFVAGVLAARIGGRWYSSIPADEMRQHIARMHDPAYGHPGR